MFWINRFLVKTFYIPNLYCVGNISLIVYSLFKKIKPSTTLKTRIVMNKYFFLDKKIYWFFFSNSFLAIWETGLLLFLTVLFKSCIKFLNLDALISFRDEMKLSTSSCKCNGAWTSYKHVSKKSICICNKKLQQIFCKAQVKFSEFCIFI